MKHAHGAGNEYYRAYGAPAALASVAFDESGRIKSKSRNRKTNMITDRILSRKDKHREREFLVKFRDETKEKSGIKKLKEYPKLKVLKAKAKVKDIESLIEDPDIEYVE